MTFQNNRVDVLSGSESREYPSRLFYMDLLLKEVQKASEAHKTLGELLDQVSEIWTAKNRSAVLAQLENHLEGRYSRRFPADSQEAVAAALSDLMRASNDLKPGFRHKADLTVSRIIKYLDPPRQLELISPWLRDERPFRINTVKRTFRVVDDLSPVADSVVHYFRVYPDGHMLRFLARTPAAAAQVFPEELDVYFNNYLASFKLRSKLFKKSDKYWAMLAAKVLIIGNQSIPSDLMRSMPEVFSWAIEEIGDPEHEAMLTWLIVEYPDNPEVLWSAIRTSGRRFMTKALDRALEAAQALLLREEGVVVIPPETKVGRD